MANVVIIGMQWGDEGKGKIVDLLGPAFDAVVRYQGGHNAGHTVRFGEAHFSLHLIPSGAVREGIDCVLGNGMVIEPDAFFKELGRLGEAGIDVEGRLFVSNRAHVVLPFAARLDQAREAARGGDSIGTTSRGIGPTYEGKTSRYGFRLGDLAGGSFEGRLRALARRVDCELRGLGAEGLSDADVEAALQRCAAWAERLAPYLRDTERLLNAWIDEGRNLLLEGAQGTLLDVDHGTYPFVTSSSSTAGGAAIGTGIPPTRLDGVLGVLKAYTTRVGAGPFATELENATGEYLRKRGNEYGTTTGRPRRCGWLDLVSARYARRINGISAIALTKLDVLDTLEEIPVCIGYRHRGEVLREYSLDLEEAGAAEPVYRTFPGWRQDTAGILDRADLPRAARDYLEFIEEEVGALISLISTGPRREETIVDVAPAGPLRRLLGGRLDGVLASR